MNIGCPEIDDNIKQEEAVNADIKDLPRRTAEVVSKEGQFYGQHHQCYNQYCHHDNVP